MASEGELSMSVNEITKIPMKVKWGYGASGYSAAIFFLNFVFYAMYFFTDIVGIGPAVAGAIVSIGALWDAATDPLIGYWSDRRDPGKGRRRPFLLWMALPLTLFTFLSFFNPGLGPAGSVAFFIIVVVGSYFCQTMVDIPYTALGAEMTEDYDERSKLTACRNAFWVVGMFMSCAFLFFVDFFAARAGGDMNKGFAYTSLLCAAPICVFLFITYASTKGYERTDVVKRHDRLNWKALVADPLKNRPFRYVTAIFALSIIAQAVNNAAGVYYFLNNLQLTNSQASYLFVFSALIGFADSWAAAKIADKLSKKSAWNICMASWAFSATVLTVFVMQPGASVVMLGFFVIFMGLGLNTQYQLALSMIPDCIEVEEFKTGERREGMYYGLSSLVQKVFAAATMAACGFVLSAIGYDGMAAVQSDGALLGIKLLFGLGVGVFLIISIAINIFNPMTRARHRALVEAIALKKANQGFSTEGFRELL
jgi:sugar (glycoside-pentoside-hexuronide) transporter